MMNARPFVTLMLTAMVMAISVVASDQAPGQCTDLMVYEEKQEQWKWNALADTVLKAWNVKHWPSLAWYYLITDKDFFEECAKFLCNVQTFISWLTDYWTTSFEEKARKAKTKVDDLDEDLKELIRLQKKIEQDCHYTSNFLFRSNCIDDQMKGRDQLTVARQKLRDAKEEYETYKYKHENGSWF